MDAQEQSDTQLLRDYAEHGREAAFREIVSRHADVVYASALRQAGSPDLARDVAQSVFTGLARKAQSLAGTLTGDASLLGWLYRSTRFAALNQLRDDRRRQARERQAMQHLDPASEIAPEWERVQPVLDEAMAELSDEDREALLLRFFKDRDFRAIGAALGISDDAAQKRVSRALERLRTGLTSRGVTTTAGALSALLVAETVSFAPAGLAATLSTAALAGTTLATAATAATATKAIAMTTLQKTLIAATLAVAVGAGIYEAQRASTLRSQVQALQQRHTEQIQQLQRERDEAIGKQAQLLGENARFNRNDSELLRLRGEVTTARNQAREMEQLLDENGRLKERLKLSNAFGDRSLTGLDILRSDWRRSKQLWLESTNKLERLGRELGVPTEISTNVYGYMNRADSDLISFRQFFEAVKERDRLAGHLGSLARWAGSEVLESEANKTNEYVR
jgi:RNA polymerase sigma factor (sigma-70 family)